MEMIFVLAALATIVVAVITVYEFIEKKRRKRMSKEDRGAGTNHEESGS